MYTIRTKALGIRSPASESSERSGARLIPPPYGIALVDAHAHADFAISERSDAAELEADHAADRVMMGASVPPSRSATADPTMNAVTHVLGSHGRPLEPELRGPFEAAFGRELGHVRVHEGAHADAATRRFDAVAVTIGPNIALAFDAPRRTSVEGRRLLAHEVAHVALGHGVSGASSGAIPVHRQERPATLSQSSLPQFSQGPHDTCTVASLITMLIAWENEAGDASHALFRDACRRTATRLRPRARLFTDWLTIENLADRLDVISRLRGNYAPSEEDYQDLARGLLFVFRLAQPSGGLQTWEAANARTFLAMGDSSTQTNHSNHSNIWELVTPLAALRPGEVAQIMWNTSGQIGAPGHAFIAGRLSGGDYFWHDQGLSPPRVYTASTPRDLIHQVLNGVPGIVEPVPSANQANAITYIPLSSPFSIPAAPPPPRSSCGIRGVGL